MRKDSTMITMLMASVFMITVPVTAQETGPERPMKGTGAWTKGTFSPSGGGECEQTWFCGPSEAILFDKEAGESVKFVPEQRTTAGVCRVTPDHACRICNAARPAEPCTWQIETNPR
jgi:hypothetical protein